MKNCFISLHPDAPEGFEYRIPEKSDLLGSKLALWVDSLESVLPVINGYEDRIYGLIITKEETYCLTPFKSSLYHLTIPEKASNVRDMASCFLDIIVHSQESENEKQTLRIELEQSFKEQKKIKQTNDRFQKRLADKIKQLNNEIERRVEIETSLRKQQELMDLTLSASAIGLAMAKNRKIIWSNDAMKQLFGRENEDLYGKDTRILYPSDEEYQRVGKIVYEKTKNQSMVDLDGEFVRKDGSIFYGQYRLVFKNPNNPNDDVIVSLIDITKRNKDEKALRQSEKRYRDLTEILPEAIFETDQNMQLTFVNKHGFDLFGYSLDDFKKGLNGLDMIAPYDRKSAYKNMMRRLNGENIGALEYMALKKDGAEFPILFHAITIMEDGKFNGIKGIIVDITQRKKIEEQLQRELLQKEILLREIHHRVKNNMNVITSLLSLQSRKVNNKAQALAAFEESKNRILSMALVHEQLYHNEDLSRVDFVFYIEKLSRKLKQIYTNDKKVRLHFDIANIFLDINYAIPCGLILNELISNAFKHAFKNRKNGDIYISLSSINNKTLQMEVKDNGVGLNESVDIEKTDSMGLQLVRILTEQLNGELSVTRNNMTSFSIRFNVE